MLAARQALPLARRRELDARLCAHVLDFLAAMPQCGVAAFHAVRGEPELGPALAALDAGGYRVHLPILVDQHLEFRRWTRGASMQRNRYGIPEPLDGQPCAAAQLDCVLMPLLAFSAAGGRLGMGGGFYDRSFAFRLQQPAGAGPRLVGVAYGLQQADELVVEPWDVPLDAVITETGVLHCKP